jgi:hypothetical protein
MPAFGQGMFALITCLGNYTVLKSAENSGKYLLLLPSNNEGDGFYLNSDIHFPD